MLHLLEFVLFREPVLDGDTEQNKHADPDDAGGDAEQERDVIGDEKLARDLLKSGTPAQSARSVAERINWLKSKMTGA